MKRMIFKIQREEDNFKIHNEKPEELQNPNKKRAKKYKILMKRGRN